jgi:glycosyltransferase involved in cell wall biosynthesis
VYARTRILLMPSEYESWGRAGVEAMASGIPVIASPTPGLKESLGKAGVFVNRGNRDGWQAAIERLDDPAAYAAASSAALRRSKQLDPRVDLARWCEAIEALG